MSGKYSFEDLFKLRASPLICKPPNLSAIEEIILSQEANAKRPSARRSVADDTTKENDGFPKRPLIDPQRKSTTDPERIVLGPPRRSFASSTARTGGKGALETSDESQTTTRDKAGFDRFKNGDSESRFPERRINGRFSKHDQDGSSDEKPRKRLDELDGDSKARRDTDRPRAKWAGDDDPDKDAKLERPSRAKFEQSWRPERGGASLDDSKREGERPGWREKRQDRGWERPGFVEDDPEWMDAPIEEEKQAPARTQEDFQRWKEKMKAGNSAPEPIETVMTPVCPEPLNGSQTKALAPMLDAEADDSMDKFFARFNETKIITEKPVTTKAPTKTRFASLFSPPPDMQQQKPTPPPMPAHQPSMEPSPPQKAKRPVSGPSMADADQAGFARIMEMLNNRISNPTTPQTEEPKPRAPLYARDPLGQTEPGRQQPVELMGVPVQLQSTARQQQPTLQELMQGSRSPVDTGHARQQSQKTDALLDLLRQANQAAKPTPPPPRYNNDSFLGAFNNMANRNAVGHNQMISPPQTANPSVLAMLSNRDNSRGPFMDEQQRMLYHEEPLVRRPTNGDTPQAGPQATPDQLLHFFRGYEQPQKPAQQSNPQQQHQLPPLGLGRPPGLDQIQHRMPPGWPTQAQSTQQQQQQQQPLRQTAAPPGMSGPPRNMPAQFGGPNMPPQQQQRPPQQPLPQRKYTGESNMGFPPGMGQPPGFPPPGFPGAHAYAGPQGMSRPQFMDMYGDGRGVRGNAAGMPGYR